MDKRLVGREKPVPTRQQVALQHPLHSVLTEHFNNATIGRQFTAIGILIQVFRNPEFLTDLVNGIEFIRGIFIGTKDAEIGHVIAHNIPQKDPKGTGILHLNLRRFFKRDAVVPEVRHFQILAQQSTIGVGIHAHTVVARRC